jgi:hypothetical protein
MDCFVATLVAMTEMDDDPASIHRALAPYLENPEAMRGVPERHPWAHHFCGNREPGLSDYA